MKKLNLSIAAIAVLLASTAMAQDNDDTNVATHQLDVNVPELALLDIYDSNTGTEAATIAMDMRSGSFIDNNKEAGLFNFTGVSYAGLYLNYTSIVDNAANTNGYDLSRQIDVQMAPNSSFPGSVDLRITPQNPVITTDGGTAASAGQITNAGVALGAETPIGSDALLVNSIESVYTGDEAFGVQLAYTLEQNGNFAAFNAGDYQATLIYTLSDN